MESVKGPTMVIGRRTDVWLRNRTLYLPDDVQHIAVSEGKLYPPVGMDYFAIAANRYPWKRVPDLVIGRAYYDNFLVSTASLYNVSLVDATETVVALHQTDNDSVQPGYSHVDSNYNRPLVGIYTAGRRSCRRTDCTKYITKLTARTDDIHTQPLLSNGRRSIVVVLRSRINKHFESAKVLL